MATYGTSNLWWLINTWWQLMVPSGNLWWFLLTFGVSWWLYLFQFPVLRRLVPARRKSRVLAGEPGSGICFLTREWGLRNPQFKRFILRWVSIISFYISTTGWCHTFDTWILWYTWICIKGGQKSLRQCGLMDHVATNKQGFSKVLFAIP